MTKSGVNGENGETNALSDKSNNHVTEKNNRIKEHIETRGENVDQAIEVKQNTQEETDVRKDSLTMKDLKENENKNAIRKDRGVEEKSVSKDASDNENMDAEIDGCKEPNTKELEENTTETPDLEETRQKSAAEYLHSSSPDDKVKVSNASGAPSDVQLATHDRAPAAASQQH